MSLIACLTFGFYLKFFRLLINTRLLRCAHPASLRRTVTYASCLVILRALHLNVFDQPEKYHFFNNLLE